MANQGKCYPPCRAAQATQVDGYSLASFSDSTRAGTPSQSGPLTKAVSQFPRLATKTFAVPREVMTIARAEVKRR